MNIDELKAMVAVDSKINPEDLDAESLHTSVLHGRYMSIMLDEGVNLRRLKGEMAKLRRELWAYYTGTADDHVYYRKGEFNVRLLKADVEKYIESDEEYLALKDKIDVSEEVVKFLEGVIRNINGRNYAIKNSIDWQRFKNGLN